MSKKIIAMCGDSTTENGNVSGGLYDRLMYYMGSNRALSMFDGVANYGKSGYTLQGFATDPATPGFIGPQENGTWDYRGFKGGETPSLLDVVNLSQENVPSLYVISYGINDCILSALGEDTEQNIVDALKPYLRTVVTTISAIVPSAVIILRSPNGMTARELEVGFPTMPNWGVNEANDQATIATINAALKRLYSEVHAEFPSTLHLDYEEKACGATDTAVLASVNPVLDDLVHPNTLGYTCIADAVADTYAGNTLYTGRLRSAVAFADAYGGNAWDYYATEMDYISTNVVVVGDLSKKTGRIGVRYDGINQRSQIQNAYSNPYTSIISEWDGVLNSDGKTGLAYLWGRFNDTVGAMAISYNYDSNLLDCFCVDTGWIFGQCSVIIPAEDVRKIKYVFSGSGNCELFLDGISFRKATHNRTELSLADGHDLMSRQADLYAKGDLYGFKLTLNGVVYCSYMSQENFGDTAIRDTSGNGMDATLINSPSWVKENVDENYANPDAYKASFGIMTENQVVVYTDAAPYYATDDAFWNPYNQDGTYTFVVSKQLTEVPFGFGMKFNF